MSANTNIEWADHTFNPWIGCTKVGPGCDHCYAEAWDRRFAVSGNAMRWGVGKARTRTKTWGDPGKWNRQHDAFFALHGRRQRVFCASLADVFDNAVNPQWRHDLFELIRATPNLDWLLLTKRIGNAKSMIDETISGMDIGYSIPLAAWPYPNVWLGATIVNQEEAERDIGKLLAVPAAKRFLSIEPMLGPINTYTWRCSGPTSSFVNWCGAEPMIDWVIVGGESGPGARPMHPDWARSLRDQCLAAGVPFFFKQWGEWSPDEHFTHMPKNDCDMHEWGEGETITGHSWRYGKKAAGRLLDGRTWDGVPS